MPLNELFMFCQGFGSAEQFRLFTLANYYVYHSTLKDNAWPNHRLFYH